MVGFLRCAGVVVLGWLKSRQWDGVDFVLPTKEPEPSL